MKAKSAENDEKLLIEAAQRDASRFGELYERNFHCVYAYVARRTGSRAEAEDVVAEVFHHALRSLHRFEWRGVPFAAWLLRIAANAIADRRERAARESGQSVMAFEPVEIPKADLEAAEQKAQVFRLVETLPDDQRRVVEMRFGEEKSVREVALAIGRSEGAVKQLQFRALKHLRERMRQENG